MEEAETKRGRTGVRFTCLVCVEEHNSISIAARTGVSRLKEAAYDIIEQRY